MPKGRRVKKHCVYLRHDILHTPGCNPTQNLRKNVHKDTFTKLQVARLLSSSAGKPGKSVCRPCLQHIRDAFEPGQQREQESGSSSCSSEDEDESELQVSPEVQAVLDKLTSGEITEHEKCLIARALGSSLEQNIELDILDLKSRSNTIDYLRSLDVNKYLKERPAPILEFYKSICRFTRKMTPESRKMATNYLCKSLEALYGARNLKFIAPFSFMENLMIYYMSQSKTAAEIFGSSCPGGVYSTLKSFIHRETTSELKCPDGDVVVAFDNNQRLSRNWQIGVNSKMPMSCITSVCSIIHPRGVEQIIGEQSPELWKELSPSDLMGRYTSVLEEEDTILRGYRYGLLDKILLQYQTNGEIVFDYEFLPPINDPLIQVVDLEPVFVNPNSLNNVFKVLKHIRLHVGIPLNRRWIALVCDRYPYGLAHKLILEAGECKICGELFQSQHATVNHIEQQHDVEEDINENIDLAFKMFYLKPGNGHIEMNLLRVIFRLLWVPCLSTLTESLGFRSEKAKNFLLSDRDHHMAWQILQVRKKQRWARYLIAR